MAGAPPRRRLISFRLSEEEYHSLKSLSGARGARNLSDFVRLTVCAILPEGSRQPVERFHEALQELRTRVAELDHIAERLSVLAGGLEDDRDEKHTA